MEKLSGATGWSWLKQGFALFLRQPAEMMTTFIAYLLLMIVVGLVPVLGQIMPMVLVPVLSIGFMQACVHIDNGKRVYPNVLMTGFRSSARASLFKLGALYLLTMLAVLGASALVDDGMLWNVLTAQVELNPKTIEDSNIGAAVLLSLALYIPASMAYWYAAALVQWQQMGIGKAIFYSFFAVWRAKRAFIVYAFGWFFVGVILPSVFGALVRVLTGDVTLSVVVMLPISLILTVIFYCSFYPTYKAMFGEIAAPDAPPPADPLTLEPPGA